jgi:hypothetical protein
MLFDSVFQLITRADNVFLTPVDHNPNFFSRTVLQINSDLVIGVVDFLMNDNNRTTTLLPGREFTARRTLHLKILAKFSDLSGVPIVFI